MAEASQAGGGAFFTDVQVGESEAGRLRGYVNALESKLDYAKWKQSLVLKYNYMPMKRITEKVHNERANYVRRIAEEEQACARMLAGKEITVQLDRFRDFSKKLSEKMEEIEARIAEEEMRRQMLEGQVADRRAKLKAVLKHNMEMVKAGLERAGVTSKEDIITLVRSRSTKDRLHPRATAITIDSKPSPTPRQLTHSSHSQTTPFKAQSSGQLFEQCLQMLVGSIQSMKSSEDIQSGIYLDIMERRKNYSSESRYSLKSKISDTLHQKFGSNHQMRQRNERNRADFEMDWDTFRELNWKQIMGIVLVKDKDCARTARLLRA